MPHAERSAIADFDPAELTAIRHLLLAWYGQNHRDFPWRETRDPYSVLVSEVMLQQTQASRIVERFPRFLRRFPTAAAVAAASPADVLREWSGLGYNRRALALHRAARSVARDGWPADVAGLERLPGVGPYTARAIASLSFGIPVGVVDTNVRRWLGRRLGHRLEGDTASQRRLQALADALAAAGATSVKEIEVSTWTHATMEFGAVVCRPRAPACERCPIALGCPSRDAPVVLSRTSRPTFAGSVRELRGTIVRRLAVAQGKALTGAELASLDTEGRLQVALDGLARDGLAHRVGSAIRLGPAEGATAVATIGRWRSSKTRRRPRGSS